MIELDLSQEKQIGGVRLKVMGLGGAGGNIVNSMIQSGEFSPCVEFIVANTDAQALSLSQAQKKIQLGLKVTKGLGAGANPEVGRRAAEEDIEAISKALEGTDILFLTCGLGGGTGTGAMPVIASIAKDMGILTVAIVTRPFDFEGRRRSQYAQTAIKQFENSVDSFVTVPNQRLLELEASTISMLDAFQLSNNILKQAIKGISDIITRPGIINVDFADVRTIMKDTGMAIMGVAKATGPHRARDAAQQAINSSLTENLSIKGAKGILINITGNHTLGLHEIHEAASLVHRLAHEEAHIILGAVIEEQMNDTLMITVIATGLERETEISAQAAQKAPPVHLKEANREEPAEQLMVQKEPESLQPAAFVRQEISYEEKEFAADTDTPAFLRRQKGIQR